jgi:tetratricopeptide (TPR) repeat protein
MVMETTVVTAAPPDPFHAQFKTYIVRSIQAALTRVNVDPLLSAEARARALHVLEYAFTLPPAWPATRQLLWALLPKMEQGGVSSDWLDCLHRAVEFSCVSEDTAAAAEFQWQLGYLYRQQSQFDRARQHLQASAAAFASLGQTHDQARALNELAFVACLQHHYREGEQLVETALQLLDETDPERALSYRIQGMIAVDYGRWQEAEEHHRKSLQLSEKQGNQRQIAWCLQNLGYALRGQARFAESIAYLERASAILDSIQDSYHWAIVQMNVGVTYRFNHQPGMALVCHTHAAKIFHKISDKLSLAKLYTNLGLDYLVLDKWAQAEQAFQLSIDLYTEIGDESWRLNAVDGLVMTYLSQKFYAKAIAILELAIAALPGIAEMPNYEYLSRSLAKHLDEAKQGLEIANQTAK